MGQADRRGTFQERKEKAIIRNGKREAEREAKALEREEKKEAELTVEEKSKRSRDRIAYMSFMAMAKRSSFSFKEIRRRVLRYNKKRI
jgi:predicted alpha/beta superfamily hydrolase